MKKQYAILIFIACFYTSTAVFSQALDSLKALARNADDERKVHLYLDIAKYYHNQQPDSLYFNYLREAVVISRNNELKAELCSSYYYIGSGFFRKTNYDSSLYFYNRSMEVAKTLKDEGMVALLDGSIGQCYLFQGNLIKAKPLLDASLEYARSIEDSVQIMSVLGYLGVYYSDKGDYYNCAEMTFEAMEIAEKFGLRRKQSILLTNLCVLYGRMKDYEIAMKYQRASLLIDREIDDKLGLAYGYNNLGNIYRRLGMADSAIYYYQLAKDYQLKMGNMVEVAGLLTNIGVYYLEANKYDEAHDYFGRALEIADSMSLIWNKTLTLMNVGNTYEDQGMLAKAEKYYLMALELSINEEYDRHEKDICLHLAKIYRMTGKDDDAYQYLERYLTIKDSMMTEQNKRTITEMRTKYETEKVERENQILSQTAQIQELELNRQQARFWIFAGGIGFILLLAALAFILYRLRQRNIRTQLERQSLENEQRMLRSQMNPHFIFNSMNSIQSYISGNDNKTAMSYLSKFARLMRGILEHSRQSMISIQDEIETLNLYVELEQLRFKDKFKYALEVDPQIDKEMLFVPPMLIQPFVENAIKHGLLNKSGEGLLKLILTREDRLIRCVVEDNGIGRDKAEARKSIGDKPHRSVGMQLTRERMDALRKEMNVDCDFWITDLKDENGEACGTRVDILIPFEAE